MVPTSQHMYCMYIHSGYLIPEDHEIGKELIYWKVFQHDWEVVYQSLRLDLFHPLRRPRDPIYEFTAGFFINLREDGSEDGMGYGREERRDERLLLQVCTKKCHGNLLDRLGGSK